METIVFLLGLVVSTFALPVDLEVSDNCTVNEFLCENGNCISDSLKCDNNDDCGDGSDEQVCGLILCEEPLNFRCKNMACVGNSSVCNGVDDCGDLSDEQNCSIPESVTCVKGQWQCMDKKLCIPIERVCNGESDCSDQSDETTGCSPKIECDGFICNSGQCIPQEWLCDGQNDCSDKSDEQNCTDKVATQTPKESFENDSNGKEAEHQETLDKLLSICTKRGELEQQYADELHSIKMQVEEENLKAAKVRVKVAELQVLIEETKLETTKLDSKKI